MFDANAMHNVNWQLIGSYASIVWSAVGPLVGVLVGAQLTRHSQRRQWIADNKKQEYREVIQVLSAAIAPIIQCVKPGLIVTEADIRASGAAENLAYEVLGSRIFIAGELDRIHAYDKWVQLIAQFEKHKDDQAFAKGFGELITEIRNTALESIQVT